MKQIFRVTAKATHGTEGRLDLIRDWPERLQHIEPMIPYLSAKYVLAHIQSKMPKGSAYRAYRAGLEVARVRGMGEGEFAYAVQVDMKNRLIRKVRPNQMLLFVHPKKRATKPDPATEILQRHNPWTFDSLPFTPDPKVGFVKTKRVRPSVVQTVTEQRVRERSVWSRELNRVGHREVRKDRRLKIPKKARVLPNVALEALKLEFGLGGAKPKPLWRVGIRRLIKSGLRAFTRNPKYFVFPLTKPSDKMWKKWPIRTKHSIPTAQAQKYVPFQRKLGIRA